MNQLRSLLISLLLVLAFIVGGCKKDSNAPVSAPTVDNSTVGGSLRAYRGSGTGNVKVTPLDGTPGFSAQIQVDISGTTPNTTFYIFRAPEVGRPMSSDGLPQRANGLWPWEQPNSPGYPAAPAFVIFPRPNSGSLDTIRTSSSGAGSISFQFDLDPALLPDGTVFDVVFRVVDSLSTSPTTDLRTDCFTVTAK